jgi:hypothetical protein
MGKMKYKCNGCINKCRLKIATRVASVPFKCIDGHAGVNWQIDDSKKVSKKQKWIDDIYLLLNEMLDSGIILNEFLSMIENAPISKELMREIAELERGGYE